MVKFSLLFWALLLACFALAFTIEEGYIEDEEDELLVVHQRELKKSRGAPVYISPPIRSKPPVLPTKQNVDVEHVRVLKELSCPFDMKLVGTQCVGRYITKLNRVCPAHTFLTAESRCISEANPVVICPSSDYTLEGGKCRKIRFFPPTLTCQEGETLINGLCHQEPSPANIQYSCARGFRLDHWDEEQHACVRESPAIFVCPPGYSDIGRQCVRTYTEPAQVFCPDGSSIHPTQKNKCLHIKQGPPTCPKKYTFDPNLQACVTSIPKIFGDCPPGYDFNGHMCVMTRISKPLGSCPAGYTIEGDACSRTIVPSPVCPSGYHPSRTSNLCEKRTKEEAHCPPGGSLVSGVYCEQTTRFEPTLRCPNDFFLVNGKCEKEEYTPPTTSCSASDCIITTRTKVSYACPEEFEFVDHDNQRPQCVARTVCRMERPSYCNDSAGLRATEECAGVRKCSSVRPGGYDEDNNYGAYGEPEELVDSVPAELYCPEGGVVENNSCLNTKMAPPTNQCLVGILDERTGMCTRLVTVSAIKECGEGAVLEYSQCVARQRTPAQLTCPEGSRPCGNGGCVMETNLIPQSPQVERLNVVQHYCADSTSKLQHNECVSTVSVPRVLKCPENAAYDQALDSCFLTTDLVLPPPVEKFVRPSYVCPTGSRNLGSSCEIQERNGGDWECRSKGMLSFKDNDRVSCVEVQKALTQNSSEEVHPPVPCCDTIPNATLHGSNCLVIDDVDPVLECGVDYDLQPNAKCTMELPMVSLCPSGSYESDDHCVREVVTNPHVRIVHGCIHNVEQPQCTGCPRPISSECYRL